MIKIGVCRHFLQRPETAAGEPGGPCHPPAHHAWAEFGGRGGENPRLKNFRLLSPQTSRSDSSTASRPERQPPLRSLSTVQKVPRRSHATCPATSPNPSARESLAPFARRALADCEGCQGVHRLFL